MTVSRVVNNKGEISPATRARVERAIERLGYRPNRLARALSLQASQTLGMVVPDINNPFFSEIVRGAEDEAWERGYALIISSTVENLEREARTLQLLEDHHVDGVLVCSPRLPDETLFELLKGHRAALVLNRSAPEALAGSLQVDDTHGAMRATHHLLGGGGETSVWSPDPRPHTRANAAWRATPRRSRPPATRSCPRASSPAYPTRWAATRGRERCSGRTPNWTVSSATTTS